MADLYFRKKQQLSNSVEKSVVADASIEIEKKRANSPAPHRGSSVVSTDKKVVYKQDLDLFKINVMQRIDDLGEKINQSVQENISKANDIKEHVDGIVKSLESSKNESLKNVLSEAVKQTNNNLHKITDELVSHLDQLNELKSRVVNIEDIL